MMCSSQFWSANPSNFSTTQARSYTITQRKNPPLTYPKTRRLSSRALFDNKLSIHKNFKFVENEVEVENEIWATEN